MNGDYKNQDRKGQHTQRYRGYENGYAENENIEEVETKKAGYIKELAVFLCRWVVYIICLIGSFARDIYRKLRMRFSVAKISVFATIIVGVILVPVVIALSAKGEPVYDDTPLGTPVARTLSAEWDGGDGMSGMGEPVVTPDPTPTLEPTPEPTVHPSNTVLEHGMNADIVIEIQKRLMKLGYMENDEPTDYYGSITRTAVKYFQRQHDLDVDGKMGAETFNLLMSDSAQKYTVMHGASGTDVTELQTRLYELGYMDHVTGFFGDETLDAVKKFQGYNKLDVDGKVGSKTREMLYSGDANAYFLKYAEQSELVKGYQARLQTLGYLTTTPDGVYGKDTVAAVKRFQELNGIIPDGFLGPNTIYTLKSSRARSNALMFGMRGDDVENMQKLLKKLGYMSNVTGYFGEETESAVKAFQKNNSLSSDGMVGAKTMTALKSDKAKKANSGSSGSGGSSGSSGSSGSGSSSSGSSSSASNSKLEKMISAAEGKLGSEYVFGAKGPKTFDCSGFVYYCLNQAGVNQSYMTSAGWAKSTKYDKITKISNLQRGDILVFDGHVGIYTGRGGMIDASSGKGKVVKRSSIWDSSYWNDNFICGFRVF